ncbi:MAG: aspartate/glutamate racemase family protein [Pseudomonadota bacterium]
MIAQGGKAISGASVGILMLDTHIPRIPGDVGNATTWPFPVHYKIVRGASPERVVLQQSEGLRDTFVAAAQELVADGVDGITTTCGFLSLMQADLKAAVPVPVAASSLMQAPLIEATLPKDKHVTILTISGASLTATHLEAAKVSPDTPVEGLPTDCEFATKIIGNATSMDIDQCRIDLLRAGQTIMEKHPNTGAIVLECTNMVPYAPDMQHVLGIPVYSIYSFILWFQAGLLPRQFPLPS